MSPSARSQRSLFLHQLPLLLWLIALWMLLWGQLTWLGLITGIVMAIFVTRVFRLPPVELSGRINLWYGLIFVVTFLGAVIKGSLIVAWQVLDVRRQPGAAIIAVPLRVADDVIMAHTAVTASLIPGSLIVDVDRENRTLYLHTIGVRSDEDAEHQRRIVLLWEARITRAVGSKEELRELRARISDSEVDRPSVSAEKRRTAP
ncbi:Na+/H+ antiporter subunit E [Microbacterium sp. 22296]|uniref:Na+/H+ antiporter subunit E n=1 Tax=Microbacterium sp. 22296 TaxID=3453903 RepID=UPI003F84C773